MRLELWDRDLSGICRFHGNAIQIRVRRGEHLWLPLLVVGRHELTHLHDCREGRSKVGEPTISLLRDRANVYVPFNQWPFKRLQSYTEYKVVWKGLPSAVVSNYR